MSEEEIDSETSYWEKLGFKVRRDPETNELVANDKWGWLRQLRTEDKRPTKPKRLDDPRIKNRARYPGKGATDQQWRTYAADISDLPGALVKVPEIGKGKRRGWDIFNLLRGTTIEYLWPCGCRQVGDDYFSCGRSSCDVNPD